MHCKVSWLHDNAAEQPALNHSTEWMSVWFDCNCSKVLKPIYLLNHKSWPEIVVLYHIVSIQCILNNENSYICTIDLIYQCMSRKQSFSLDVAPQTARIEVIFVELSQSVIDLPCFHSAGLHVWNCSPTKQTETVYFDSCLKSKLKPHFHVFLSAL